MLFLSTLCTGSEASFKLSGANRIDHHFNISIYDNIKIDTHRAKRGSSTIYFKSGEVVSGSLTNITKVAEYLTGSN